jgi:hypothetical protein
MAKGMISKRTASKIFVSNDVPEELFQMLTPESGQMLRTLLAKPQQAVGVRRLPVLPPALPVSSHVAQSVKSVA